MPLPNAPYTGGYSPGAQLFGVDGDFTSCDPASLPEFSFPFKGDSILSLNDLIVFDVPSSSFLAIPLGIFPNIHPWTPNQNGMVLEQDFIVAEAAYITPRLNSPYNPMWAIGWEGVFPDGLQSAALNQFLLVEEGQLQDIGAGLVKIRRKFATLPPSRSEIEQFAYTFVGLDSTGSTLTPLFPVQRPQETRNVLSRIQYDYFLFDFYDIIPSIPVFPYGPKLDATTGLYPPGLIFSEMQYFSSPNVYSNFGLFIGTPTDSLSDGDTTDPNSATAPTATDYLGWTTGLSTSNGQPAEIVAEPSTFTRWMGNIWERRTRLVQIQ